VLSHLPGELLGLEIGWLDGNCPGHGGLRSYSGYRERCTKYVPASDGTVQDSEYNLWIYVPAKNQSDGWWEYRPDENWQRYL